jgi:hypothetical protein
MATSNNKGKSIILSRRADIKPNGLEGSSGGAYIKDALATFKRPKLKFNYTVSFNFRKQFTASNENPNNLNSDGDIVMADDMTFAIKQASRPNPTVIYQDLNYYNYRTKVATKVDYGTMQLTMYDDVANHGHDIFEHYLKSISPIANRKKNNVNSFKDDGYKNIAFNSGGVNGAEYTSGSGSIGPLPEDAADGLIADITIRHWFFSEMVSRNDGSQIRSQEKPANPNAEFGDPDEFPQDVTNRYDTSNIQFVEYQFINPKVVNMTLDELDMSQSDVSTVMMNFVYDSVYISSPKPAGAGITIVPDNVQKNTTLNDVLSRIRDAERMINKFKRLDTIPDLSVLQTVGAFIPSGLLGSNLAKIPDIKPDIDLPPVLDILNQD